MWSARTHPIASMELLTSSTTDERGTLSCQSEGALARVGIVRSAEVDEIVERAKKGDREAFRELFRRHRADVARLAYRMLGSATELEDVVQEVFLQVHKSLADFRGQS